MYMVVILKMCLSVRKKTYLVFESYSIFTESPCFLFLDCNNILLQSDQSVKKLICFKNKKMLIDGEEA